MASKSARPYRGVAHELEHLVHAITLLEERNGMVQAVATHLEVDKRRIREVDKRRLLLQCYICPSYVFTQEWRRAVRVAWLAAVSSACVTVALRDARGRRGEAVA